MPKGNHPRFTQAQFDIVAEWFDRACRCSRRTSHPIPADSCTTTIGAGVAAHATAMATQGWGRINKTAGLTMFGCGAATDPRNCLASMPDATTRPYGTGWANAGTLRVLRELAFNTIFWMRSSADGRFVANVSTVGSGAVITILQTGKDIAVDAAYDPGFFPDNRGWMFQGTPIGAGFCTNALLVANPDTITFGETQCSSVSGVGLYQHLGAGINNSDYFAINGQFTSDFPGPGVTRDPSTGFSQSAQMSITPMVFNGMHFVPKPPAIVASPSEGDAVLSPSTGLIASRFGNAGSQLGFVVRKVTATPNAASSRSPAEIARYCGRRPARFSFDERYMVYHTTSARRLRVARLRDVDRPVFQDMLARGTANVMMRDLVTARRSGSRTCARSVRTLSALRSDG